MFVLHLVERLLKKLITANRCLYCDDVYVGRLYFVYLYVHRFCQRVVPVTTVCHATLEDIQKQASSLLDPHFHVDDLQVVKVSPAQITL